MQYFFFLIFVTSMDDAKVVTYTFTCAYRFS